MSDHYGPQTAMIEDLIEHLRNATPEQLQAIDDAYYAAIDDAYYAAAVDVAHSAVANIAFYAAHAAAHAAAAVRIAAYDAAFVLAIRHLVDSYGFTWEYYNALVAPVMSVLGPIHPDDE